ncbi:MAG: 6,7-dimethyl-8-ribityllumazine synthase [Planctomycetes bacterium]|nr:6,7-dimethyl-8-ribityllumazine synthase [Planctomycetota bacterium]MCB9908725.1 6,7-dimethyl-8-ribityllumazine synthase [Planctomycetota bacterium]MCB9912450.1 6,7-dimethyl-8-ribityllumazine synthase [Planctomycetota bacterium]HPF14024.1 6,7-dimethyl-8-ribityllumazine synthase [Planctomycetota bacterium]
MAQPSHRPTSSPPPQPGVRVACVVSTYHEELTGAMAAAAKAELLAGGMQEADWHPIPSPGAFELPLIARRLARRNDIDAVLCFGLVLTGETNHDHWVSQAATEGILRASLETDKPILFGVLTCQTLAQARSRALPPEAGGKQNKGREVARAALWTLAALKSASSPTLG